MRILENSCIERFPYRIFGAVREVRFRARARCEYVSNCGDLMVAAGVKVEIFNVYLLLTLLPLSFYLIGARSGFKSNAPAAHKGDTVECALQVRSILGWADRTGAAIRCCSHSGGGSLLGYSDVVQGMVHWADH
jgi:hypothetical protein